MGGGGGGDIFFCHFYKVTKIFVTFEKSLGDVSHPQADFTALFGIYMKIKISRAVARAGKDVNACPVTVKLWHISDLGNTCPTFRPPSRRPEMHDERA